MTPFFYRDALFFPSVSIKHVCRAVATVQTTVNGRNVTKIRAAPPRIATRAPRFAMKKVRASVYGTLEHREWSAEIIRRSGGCCQDPACAAPYRAGARLFADHVVELRDGGGFSLENGLARCGSCHSRKTLAERARRLARKG
jgi:5-methylcytosine-specific restriction protein A